MWVKNYGNLTVQLREHSGQSFAEDGYKGVGP